MSQIPIRRALGWSVFALLIIAGIVLYFLYGDFVAPVLVMLERGGAGEWVRALAPSA